MRDYDTDLLRRGLWLAGGCAALGAIVILRSEAVASYPPWLAWSSLVLSVFVAAAAVETGGEYVDLTLSALGFAASILGLILFAIGLLVGRTMDDLLNLGPLVAVAGFALGAIGTGASLSDVFRDLLEYAKQRPDQSDASTETLQPLSGSTKTCPHCGQSIPAYAAACSFCKCILKTDLPTRRS